MSSFSVMLVNEDVAKALCRLSRAGGNLIFSNTYWITACAVMTFSDTLTHQNDGLLELLTILKYGFLNDIYQVEKQVFCPSSGRLLVPAIRVWPGSTYSSEH